MSRLKQSVLTALATALIIFAALTFNAARQNYLAGLSGPFEFMRTSKSTLHKELQFKSRLETHFAAKHRADDVEAYLSAMKFDCDFPKGDWIVSRLGDLKGGAVLMCSYRFDGSFYLLPDNMIVSVYFDSNLQSVRFEQIVEVV